MKPRRRLGGCEQAAKVVVAGYVGTRQLKKTPKEAVNEGRIVVGRYLVH